MDHLISQALDAVLKQGQCLLCEVKFNSKAVADSHFTSRRHLTNVTLFQQSLRKNMEKKNVPVLQSELARDNAADLCCKICDMMFPTTKTVEQHLDTERHKSLLELYCDICQVTMASKLRLWEHLKGPLHEKKMLEMDPPQINGPYSPFCDNLPKALKDQMLADECMICNKTLPTIKYARNHYSSTQHDIIARRWFKDMRQTARQARDLVTIIGNQKIADEALARCVDPTMNTAYIYCYLCEEGMGSRIFKNHHVAQFPHADLIHLKSKLIKQGVVDEFWILKTHGIVCRICPTGPMHSSPILWGHLNSERHAAFFEEWVDSVPIQKPLPDSESRWYYCEPCGRAMDGTSDADRHYAAEIHNKNIAIYCQVCDVHTSTPELLKLHCKTTQHLENLNKQKKKAGKIATIEGTSSKARKEEDEAPSTKPSKSENIPSTSSSTMNPFKLKAKEVPANPHDTKNVPESGNLKDQVFNELEKLIRKLYYSRTVPYDVALRYLQQVNKEVDALGKKFAQNNAVIADSQDHATNDNASTDNNASVAASVENVTTHPVIQEACVDEAHVTLVEDCNVTSVESVTKEAHVDEAFDSTSMDTVANVPSVIEESPAAEVINTATMEDDISDAVNEGTDSIGAASGGPRDIPALLNDIVERKLEVERDNASEQIEEAAVLNEIETLLRQVSAGSCPLDETLKCLRNFNDLLETRDLSEDVGAHVETPPPDNRQTSELTYSKEALLAMRTPSTFANISNELMRVLLASGVFAGHNAAMADQDCQVSIYNYYAGNNFAQFREFLDVYLQGSVDLVRQRKQDD